MLAFLTAGCNFLAIPLLRATDGGSNFGMEMIVWPATWGVVAGEFSALTLWLCWGDGPFLRRLITHWLVAVGLYCAAVLGFAVAMPDEYVIVRMWREIVMTACVVPLFSLATQLPLWPLRTHFGWRVEQPGSDLTTRAATALSIGDILAGTAVVAVSFGLARAPQMLIRELQVGGTMERSFLLWQLIWTTMSGLLLSVALLIPTTIFVMRWKETATALGLFATYLVGGVMVGFAIVSVIACEVPPIQPIVMTLIAVISFGATAIAPLLVLRQHGYRLTWPRDRRRAESAAV